jgi:transposase-like protein
MNLIKLFEKFPTERHCIIHLESIRWAKGVECPYCESMKTCKHLDRHQCQSCHKSFSVTVNTIFHHTHLDLRHWFYIIALMLNAKKGASAYQISRDIGIRRPTVWAIMHKIRSGLGSNQQDLIKGIFEMDETYLKARKDKDDDQNPFIGNCGRSLKNNTPIVALKQKGGDLKAFVTENTKYYTLGKIALDHADLGSEFHTDEYSGYKLFGKFFKHKTVNHSKEYVTADKIHCNSIENFWSLLKRGIKGNFHWVRRKYLQNYINEFEYRFNNRNNEFVFEQTIEAML